MNLDYELADTPAAPPKPTKRRIGAAGDGSPQTSTTAPQAWTSNTGDLTPNPAGYHVDDLIIDLGTPRLTRAGTVLPLKALSFDLLVTLVRGALGDDPHAPRYFEEVRGRGYRLIARVAPWDVRSATADHSRPAAQGSAPGRLLHS